MEIDRRKFIESMVGGAAAGLIPNESEAQSRDWRREAERMAAADLQTFFQLLFTGEYEARRLVAGLRNSREAAECAAMFRAVAQNQIVSALNETDQYLQKPAQDPALFRKAQEHISKYELLAKYVADFTEQIVAKFFKGMTQDQARVAQLKGDEDDLQLMVFANKSLLADVSHLKLGAKAAASGLDSMRIPESMQLVPDALQWGIVINAHNAKAEQLKRPSPLTPESPSFR